jgi:hypothetical protein
MELRVSALADYTSVTGDGKLNVLGVFSVVNTQEAELPVAVPAFYFVVQYAMVREEFDRDFPCRVQVTAPDHEVILIGDVNLRLDAETVDRPDAGGGVNLAVPLGGFAFQQPGTYRFECIVEGGPTAGADAYVIPPRAQEEGD